MTQTFCRHNRFIQRCPICRETVPGQAPARPATPKRPVGTTTQPVNGTGGRVSSRRAPEVKVHHEQRAEDDGYRCELVPGLRSSHDARRLVQEIGFSSGRLLTLTAAPPSLYAEARDCEDIEQATWMCFLCAYLSPLQGSTPFAGVRHALLAGWASGDVPDLTEIPLGPRTVHDPARGSETLVAYRRFAAHAGSQELAFSGEPSWTPQRRFERVFERLALPGFGRVGRYELLVLLGRLGLYELRADSLHLATRSPSSAGPAGDPTLLAAKRIFGIGDPLHLERRAGALAQAISTPIEALDLAFANWAQPTPSAPQHGAVQPAAPERATLGFPPDTNDVHAVERAGAALDL